jgi:Uma2 family endonuclease
MAVLVLDPFLESHLKAVRRENDSDGHDEVWEGLHVMAPLPNDDHQEIQSRAVGMLQELLGWDSPAKIRAGVNVSDRHKDWQNNYRDPDVVVYLPGNPAKNYRTHWQGGPDFLIEIVSPFDRSREKLPFYAKVAVREVLIIDRDPWTLELYVRGARSSRMRLAGKTNIGGLPLSSSVLPLKLAIISGKPRPRIEAVRTDLEAKGNGRTARRRWLI